MNLDGALTWREVIEKHSAALVDEVTARLDSELEKARDETRAAERSHAATETELLRERTARETRLAVSESLNQAIRRIRQAESEETTLGILLESAAVYSQQAVVLRVENNQVRSLGVRGLRNDEPTPEFMFDPDAAAAIAGVCETRDPAVALVSDNELSHELASALSDGDSSRKAYLFPVAVRHNVEAILVAAGDTVPAVLELLSEASGMRLEVFAAERAADVAEKAAAEKTAEAVPILRPLSGSDLVQIAPPSVPETPGAERLKWSDLSPEDQKLHLQAQRVARVKVAEMRLYQAEELRKGVFESNIYGALQTEIDQARADFLQTFLSKSRTMVDYLHLEILRSLAHDDDRLLGQGYPGPMV